MDQVQLRVLTDEEVRRIINEAFALLADTGAAVDGEGVRNALARAGARVEANVRVRLPKELTKELLAMAPPSHDCETIGGEHIEVGGGGQKVVSLVLDPLILDYADGLRPHAFRTSRATRGSATRCRWSTQRTKWTRGSKE